jgi:NAD(P)-dependent dehydrogenase (short-subunit alcohol dehydrogenase family)
MKKLSMFDLTGKVAIITGGYGGIGRGIAEGLAEAGCHIVICARNYERCVEACKKIKKLGVKALPIRCDVTKKDEVDNLVRKTVKEMGGINVLINNAGVEGKEKPCVDMSEEEWDEIVNTNLKGAFLCSKAAVKEMIKQGGGKIINVASITAFVVMENVSAYCASKGGLVQLTKAMALEFVKYNIQVNAICPGYFSTPMSRRLYKPEMWRKIARRNVPMGRIGKPQELKGTAVYLASSATDFMTGSCIVIDGGQLIW